MRRPNGCGTISKLSGARRRPYMVRVPVRDRWGMIHQTPIGYYRTSAEAQEALDEYNRRRRSDIPQEADKLRMTVGDIYELWIQRTADKIGPSALRAYSSAWRQSFGVMAGRRVRDLSLDEMQRLLDEDAQRGYSARRIETDIAILRAVCRYAIQRDIIDKDYSRYLERPTVTAEQHTKGALTDLQLRRLEEMAAEGRQGADIALILCYTGYRVSELLELTRFAYHPEEGGYLQGGKKTRAGKDRIVPIHPRIRRYILAGLERGADRLISDSRGNAISPTKYRKTFGVLAQELGSPEATPHWCRHTFATLLHNAGVDPLTAKWLLGHSTEQDITQHYTHPVIKLLIEAVRKIA